MLISLVSAEPNAQKIVRIACETSQEIKSFGLFCKKY